MDNNNKFQREVLDRLIVLETLLKQQDYKGLSKKTDEAYHLALQNKQEIDELKDRNRWILRAIVGALIAGFVGLLFVYIKLGLGVN